MIPFLPNDDQVTPLDLAISKNDHKQINAMIKLLSKTPMDHHSRFITHLVPTMIEMGVPAAEKYFDKRIFKPEICNSVTLGKVQSDSNVVVIPSTLANDSEEQLRKALNRERNVKEH